MAVKVVDIFGNDTMKIVEVSIGEKKNRIEEIALQTGDEVVAKIKVRG